MCKFRDIPKNGSKASFPAQEKLCVDAARHHFSASRISISITTNNINNMLAWKVAADNMVDRSCVLLHHSAVCYGNAAIFNSSVERISRVGSSQRAISCQSWQAGAGTVL
jgi:hypothetical protein